ncbi:hypothetical protein AJ79_00173 [Helicocarpus griseus UAMH5409]|uniref:Uncharacterized protein n=1 Tax=Helicocarpus griseus UAMH5409 TaxID=1447875 RepID=A0A2B7YC30_9EURO|nr:hypothetical protein AJ79_00173 [Helicocarpus griseus UAMH5409]
MTLRRTPTRSTFGPTPLSKQHLRVPFADSPLPSPSLPSIVPCHGKQLPSKWPRRAWRLLCWTIGVVLIIWFVLSWQGSERLPHAVNYLSHDGGPLEIVGSDDLPEAPSPVMVTDQRGRSRWTISIPRHIEFPLPPSSYARICSQAMELSHNVENIKNNKPASAHRAAHHGYYWKDKNFMDVSDAENNGLLPTSGGRDTREGLGVVGGEIYTDGVKEVPVCEKSLTYVMQTEDAGMGATIMGVWMSYGLAQYEGRAFFVDDTNWAYGKYTTYFKLPPMPSCRPPPSSQRIPCPHQARHLLISSATTTWSFGHAFNDKFEDAHKMGIHRQKNIFNLLRTGYEALFHLTGDDAKYLSQRLHELNTSIRAKGGIEVGIHVRHGDRHPMEFQYQKSYLPLELYIDTAYDILTSFRRSNIKPTPFLGPDRSRILLASDDPDVYSAGEMVDTEKAQSMISLVSKSALDAATAAQGGSKNMMDGNIGWEGGFFRDMFWSLGAPPPPPAAWSPPASRREPHLRPRSVELADMVTFRFHPPPDALQLRELIGRAYLLDLAVLGQSDAVVCGVSSVACRLLAVMVGWEGVVSGSKWKNVDGTWGWKGIIW